MQENKLHRIVVLPFIFLAIISCQEQSENHPVNNSSQEITYDIDFTKSKVYTTTAGDNTKLELTNENVQFSNFVQPLETQASILVNPEKQHQTFVGIGAAFTDASAETYYKLKEDQQKLFLEAYFSIDNGIGYSFGRTIIHSCDFSPYSYTYIEEGDAELKTFNINHDKEFRIPFTKLAIEAAGGEAVTL